MTPDAQLGAMGTALLLVWIRTSAVLLLAPLLGGRPLPWWAALPLAGALSFALAPFAPTGGDLPRDAVLSLAIREAAAGAVLGLSARIVFSIFESAGRLVGVSAFPGAAQGPGSSQPFGFLFAAVGVAAFFVTGGHRALVLALDGSFRAFAPGSWDGAAAGADAVVALFSGAFAGAVMISAPVFAAVLAAEAAVGIAARLAPRAGLEAEAPAIRAICAQLAAVGAMAVAVQAGVDFLNSGLARAAGVS